MENLTLKQRLPTFFGYLERRRERKKNQLPKHLRPVSRWPLVFHLALNIGIFLTLLTLVINQDDYVTDAGPAVIMVICLLLLIYALISAFQLRQRFEKLKGHRLAQINLWVMFLALVMFPICVANFLR
jgi:hypothetical protein